MIGNEKIWEQCSYDELKAGRMAYELGISPLVTGILLQRGYDNLEKMSEFLYGSGEPFHDPFLMSGMQRAVHRIRQAIENNEKITIYGDYDVDGITATSVLFIYLRNQGAVVDAYIPKRENEGYGLNDAALLNIAANGTSLLITVDCGISGLKEVAAAPKSMDIIITDHHTVPPEIPAAYAVVDPKQDGPDNPFVNLCGAGIAFKICQALELGAGKGMWTGLLEIVALGTVADIVPLVGENREIVRRGLKAMETTHNIGLQALIRASGCPEEKLNSEHIGFCLAPRLNAVGRLGHALEAVKLLITEDPLEAENIALELNHANDIRKDISNKIQQDAEAMLQERKHLDTCIVLASPEWHPGVIGIVASRMVDKYNLPTILLSVNNGVAKGSCRSIPSLNLYEAIAAQSDLLSQFGGHHQAAGLTLPLENLEEFTRRFTEYVKNKLKPEDYIPRQSINMLLTRSTHIGLKDLDELELLEPFGCGNPVPVFAYEHAQLQNVRSMGKNQEHLSFTLNKGYDSYKVVMWNHAYLLPCLYDYMVADVAFVPRKNTWNDETTVQLHGLSVRQNVVLIDERQNNKPKEELLRYYLNDNVKKTVVFRELPKGENWLTALLQEAEAEAITYDRILEAELPDTVILYDIPLKSITAFFATLKMKAKNIVLMYRGQDLQKEVESMKRLYPQREELVVAYRTVMGALENGDGLDKESLLLAEADKVSSVMIQVMQELEFVFSKDNLLYKSPVIKKCSLEDSPLFCKLQEERNYIISALNTNMRLTQSDLLRGRRE